jgi:hypothetical protein
MRRLFYLLLIIVSIHVACTSIEKPNLEGVWNLKYLKIEATDSLVERNDIKFNICSDGTMQAIIDSEFDAFHWKLKGDKIFIFQDNDTLIWNIEYNKETLRASREYPYYGEISAELVRVGNSLPYEVFLVKNGYMKGYTEICIGEAIDSFFGEPEWKVFIGQDEQLYLNVSGNILLFNNNAEAVLQFRIDRGTNKFAICAMELNGVPQNELVIIALLDKMYGKEISEEEFYNPKPKLPAAPLNIYIFQNISESIQRLAAKRSNEFDGKETIDKLKLSKEIVEEAFEINNYSYAATIKKVANDGFTANEVQMTQILLIPVFDCETDEEVEAIYTTEELKGINEIIRMVEVYKGN